MTNDARWAPDPEGHFAHRWWDGTVWTDRVAIDGHEASSPPGDPGAAAAAARLRARSMPPPPPVAAPVPVPPPVYAPQHVVAPYVHQATPVGVGPVGHRLATNGSRFGAYLLDGLLFLVTLGIGWTIWAMVTAAQGQTPAKRIVGIQVVDSNSGRPLSWAQYVFVRGLIGWGLQALLNSFLVGFVLYLMPLWDAQRQHLPAKISGSVDVVV